jgi:ornithine cyclodeaminase
MRQLDKSAVVAALPWDGLHAAFARHVRGGLHGPAAPCPSMPEGGTLLLMPARNETHAGVKIVHVAPGNAARGLPAVHAQYLLSDAVTGAPLALLDGGELTTGAPPRLGAGGLVPGAGPISRRLLVLGRGQVAAALAEAHHAHFGLAEIAIWARRPEQGRRWPAGSAGTGLPARAPPPDPRGFDISLAADAGATAPLIRGAELRPASTWTSSAPSAATCARRMRRRWRGRSAWRTPAPACSPRGATSCRPSPRARSRPRTSRRSWPSSAAASIRAAPAPTR